MGRRLRSRVTLVTSFALAVAALAGAACVIHVTDTGEGLVTFWGDDTDLREHVQRTERHALDVGPSRKLILEGSWGDVWVDASGSGAVEVRATLDARGRSQGEAEAVLARYRVEITESGDAVRVRLAGEPLAIVDGSHHMSLAAGADFELSLPSGTPLEVTVGAGDIETRGVLGASRLKTGVGDVQVAAADTQLSVETGAGDVELTRFDGSDLRLRTGVGDVDLVEASAESVDCSSGAGEIVVGRVHARRTSLVTGSGDIDARGATGDVVAHSSSGDVHVAGVEGTVDASSGSGSVDVHGRFHGLVARSSSGDVTVRVDPDSRVESEWVLDSGSGDVLLRVPDGFGCRVHARTGSGEVECDLPVVIEAGHRDSDSHLLGQVGSGGGQVSLSSGSGDVALRRR